MADYVTNTMAGGRGAKDTSAGPAARDREQGLQRQLDRMRNNRSGYFSVYLNLSELQPAHRQPYSLRMVVRTFDSLINAHDVLLFQMHNGDMALLCRDAPVDDVDTAVFKARSLFSEDPLTQGEDGSIEDRFSTWYDLSQDGDFETFVSTVNDLAKRAEIQQNHKADDNVASGRASSAQTGAPLEPEILGGINRKLQDARIGDLIRQQPAIRVGANGQGEMLFREHYISMGPLQKRIAPNVNLFSSHWLFQYLSETLDARLLGLLGKRDFGVLPDAISLNLNLNTVSGRPFQAFHNAVGENTHKVVVEIQVIDLFSDMGGYARARDWLQERGYRVLIDGLNPLSLQFFDPSHLRADFIKFGWGAEVRGTVGTERTRRIADVVARMPKNSVVLSRVDSEEGVEWGLNIGVRCFQGRFIDTVVDAMAAKGKL